MLIAHLSDLHVRGDGPIAPLRLLGKRATGYANLRFRRSAAHQKWAVQTLSRELRRLGVDHVAVTGDLTNLALEDEFAAARHLLDHDLGLPAERVTVIPGNHDVYTRGSMHQRRFAHYLGPYLRGDLPQVPVDHPAGPFPFVRLRDSIALVGLATALPSPPLCAYGQLGASQLASLRRLLHGPDLRDRFVVGLLHHPPFNPPSALQTLRNGLHDAAKLRQCFDARPALLLHGHLHRRMVHREGSLTACGATSASLLSEHPDHHAGFNLYEVDASGLVRSSAMVLEGSDRFLERVLPAA